MWEETEGERERERKEGGGWGEARPGKEERRSRERLKEAMTGNRRIEERGEGQREAPKGNTDINLSYNLK